MITLDDYLDSMLISINDIKQRLEMEEPVVKPVVLAWAKRLDEDLGELRDNCFES